MDVESIQPGLFTIKYVEVLPATYPCPDCGQEARRNSTGERTLQEPDLERPTFLLVRMSVCKCINPVCARKYFRVPLPFAAPRLRYSETARQVCVSSITRDGMPFCRVPERVADDFHLYPATSTVWEWHRQACGAINLTADYEPWVKAPFSGVLCIDELYEGALCLILSTDPLNDVTVAYTLEPKAEGEKRPQMNQAWLDRHLTALQRIGITPEVVIRDGAVVYDQGLPEGWDQARCNFHLIQNITDDVLKAVNAYRKSLPDLPKRSRGRPPVDALPPPPDVKTEIWQHRYLWVSRPETIEAHDRTCTDDTHRCCQHPEAQILQDLCDEHPPLATARQCLLDIWALFDDPNASFETVKARYETLAAQPTYQVMAPLRKAIQSLKGETLEKAGRFLAYENLPKTNNHVENQVRRFRKRQKGHYKLRRCHTIDRAMKAELMRQKARKQARGDPRVQLQPKASRQTLPVAA